MQKSDIDQFSLLETALICVGHQSIIVSGDKSSLR